jgi:hypothetical protein
MRRNIIIILGLIILLIGLIYWFSDKPPYYKSDFSTATLQGVNPQNIFAPLPEDFPKTRSNIIASTTLENQLENRDYLLQDCCDENNNSRNIIVSLNDGKGTHPFPVRFESDKGEVELYSLTNSTLGDLNGDGQADAAVLIYSHLSIGNGYAPFLVALLNQNGSFKQVSEIDLGGRDNVNSISIKSGQVIVDMMIHGPNDGACCASVHKIYKYNLGQLIKENGTTQKDALGSYLL